MAPGRVARRSSRRHASASRRPGAGRGAATIAATAKCRAPEFSLARPRIPITPPHSLPEGNKSPSSRLLPIESDRRVGGRETKLIPAENKEATKMTMSLDEAIGAVEEQERGLRER